MRQYNLVKYRRILNTSVISLVFILASCSSFLEENPKDRFVVDNFYQSEADVEAAVNAIYEQLYDIYKRNMYLLCDLPTDDHKNGQGMPNAFLLNLEYLRLTAGNSFVQDMWKDNYSGIMRANTTIENTPRAQMDESLRAQYFAEARFLRALFYFNLVRFFGDVPLMTESDLDDVFHAKRDSKESIYAQIVTDLKYAEEYLPISRTGSNGRASQGAAKILLAKVYLTNSEFLKAKEMLDEVILNENVYNYGLHNNYKDNWIAETEFGVEMVFSIDFMDSPATPNNEMALCGPKYSIRDGAGVPGLKGGKEADIPTVELYSLFNDEDERKAVTFKLDYISPKNNNTYTSSIPLFGKYWEEGEVLLNQSDANMHILRYADALLMYAEALNETGKTTEALNYLNRVRERAFHNSNFNYEALNQEQFRLAVWKERRLEFALEGHRWFDLVRTKRYVDRMKKHGTAEAELAENNKTEITQNVKDYMVLMPIPQYEIDLNPNLYQNEGY